MQYRFVFALVFLCGACNELEAGLAPSNPEMIEMRRGVARDISRDVPECSFTAAGEHATEMHIECADQPVAGMDQFCNDVMSMSLRLTGFAGITVKGRDGERSFTLAECATRPIPPA